MLAQSARADLSEDVAGLLTGWRLSGARAARVTTLFLSAGERRTVEVPFEPTEAAPCVTVVALGARGVSFSLAGESSTAPLLPALVDGPEPADDESEEVDSATHPSRAGVAELMVCRGPKDQQKSTKYGDLADGARVRKTSIAVTFASSRGAVEVLAAGHREPLPLIDTLLLERAAGPLEMVDDRRAPMALAPLPERLKRASRIAWMDGASEVVTIPARSSVDGAGVVMVELRAGCHRIGVLADAEAVDVDAELREPGDAVPLRRDRSHAPDARLEVCVTTPRRLELSWFGAGEPCAMALLDSLWKLPLFPREWSHPYRAAMAWALWKRRAPRVQELPVGQWLGVTGATHIPLVLEPGACYLAALALGGTDAVSARLNIEVAGENYHDEAGELPNGAAVTFCAGAASLARALVESRAGSGNFRLALWRLSGETW